MTSKLFKEVKEGDYIYGVYEDGFVTLNRVKAKNVDMYEHMCHFYFDVGTIKVNMYMCDWIGTDADGIALMYFADKDKAIEYINDICNKAKEEIKNCEESLNFLNR